nr:immunoglobulin heavy chain junction region [Mus musculus]
CARRGAYYDWFAYW